MLNLDWAISQFISNPPRWASGEIEADHAVLGALADPTSSNRRETLRSWMERYSPLLSFPREKREEACSAILHFADALPRHGGRLKAGAILLHFEALEAKLRPLTPLDHNGLERDITSLTSKALWCCLPNDAPVFDRNVRSALAMLSRLMDVDASCEGMQYARFVDLWIRIHDRLAPRFTDSKSIHFYGNRVRLFDRFLWSLGNPDLCSRPQTLASSADF